ncbi:MAG TPA: trigger factor [Terriglobia bacterium]|nr:trigger factor [Terriglobia bacterium]
MEAETCKRELVIEIPPDVVQKESESVANEYARKARVPGFRPGHVPRDFILRRFRSAIQEEVAQTLLPRFFRDAVRERNLPVVGDPKFEPLEFEEDRPLTAKAIFEVYPTIELGSYKGLEVTEEEPSVSDEDISKAIESLRESATTYEVAEGRSAEEGDLLTVSYEGRDVNSLKNRLVQVKEGTVRLGAEGTLTAFTDNLRGAKAGDIREFEVAYPADFVQKNIAGRTIKFRVEVLGVKRRVVPALDDDFAKTVSSESTLEDLRVSLRKQIREARQKEAEAASKRKLLETLMDRQKFPTPEILIDERLNEKLRQMAGQMIDQGIDPRKAQLDWEKLREELRPAAEKDVRGTLILQKIAEAEKIEVSEEEIDDSLRQLAAGGTESPAALKTRLTRNGGLARLQSGRLSQKALDFIYHNAKVVRQLSLV